TLSTNANETNTTNNSASTTAAITTVADLAISDVDANGAYNLGQTVTYTVVASNTGPSQVSNVTITDVAPLGLSGINYSVASTPGVAGAVSGSGDIDQTNITMPAGASITYMVTGTVSAATAGTLVTSANISHPSGTTSQYTDPNTSNNNSSHTYAINGGAAISADVAVTIGDTTYLDSRSPGQLTTGGMAAVDSTPAHGIVTYSIIV